MLRLPASGALTLFLLFLAIQPTIAETVGPQSDGRVLLPTGWKLKPAGTQVEVGQFPLASALSKDGKFLIVLNAGIAPPTLSVIDVASKRSIGQVPVPDGWLGLTFNSSGDHLYVGGGAHASIFEFTFTDGKLAAARTFYLVDEVKRTSLDFTGDLAFSPDGRLLYAADLFRNTITVVNPRSGVVIERIRTGRRPYRILFAPDGKTFFVTSWADGTLTQYQSSDGTSLSSVRLGAHPTDMVWRHTDSGNLLYVAVANTNSVYTVAVPESGELTRGEVIKLALFPNQLLGTTPSALAFDSHAGRLYVACSDLNAVAEISFSEEGASVVGWIPVGWYPTSVQALPSGELAVLNGRGARSFPDRAEIGTVNFVPPHDDRQLATFTREELTTVPAQTTSANAVPPAIKHVVWIMIRPVTFDHLFGDLAPTSAGKASVKFGSSTTPNLHKLAHDFVVLDNFHSPGSVVADGLGWAMSGIASDYVVKLLPSTFGRRRGLYDFEGADPASFPPAGYLWNNAAQAGVSLRNYGFWVDNKKSADPDGAEIQKTFDPQLAEATDMEFRGADAAYPDTKRASEFTTEIREYEQTGSLPKLLLVQLTGPPGFAESQTDSQFADNDRAVGMMVEAISKSKFWNETLVLISAPAGDGVDHIDSHRVPALMVSPWCKRGSTYSEFASTASLLKTLETALKLRPMTLFDSTASGIASVFTTNPVTTQFVPPLPSAQ